MVILGNKSPDSNRFTLVTPKPENGVRLQATLGNQNPTGLPVGSVRCGARQVSKTWLMKEFGQNYYESYVYFNFDEEDELKSIFEAKALCKILWNLTIRPAALVG